jgi:hypothetical protein
MNQYFIDQSHHVLGEICLDQFYGNERLAVKSDGRDLSEAIAEVLSSIKPGYTELPENFTRNKLISTELQSSPVNSFCLREGQLSVLQLWSLPSFGILSPTFLGLIWQIPSQMYRGKEFRLPKTKIA